MKFKAGDKVRVRNNSKYASGMYAGMRCKVISTKGQRDHPYHTKFKDGSEENFHANELEKVE